MWTIIMRLTRSKWFLNYATSCTWNENNKSEDVLAQIKKTDDKCIIWKSFPKSCHGYIFV